MPGLNNKGISLIEVLVSVFIFLILSTGIYTVLYSSQAFWQVNEARVQAQQQLRRAMEGMIDELREAGSGSILDVPADGAWRTSITFRVPSGVTAGSLVWNGSNINFARGGTGGTQLLRTQGGATSVLANNIQLLRFRRLGATPDKLEISLTAQKKTLKGVPANFQVNFDVQLRN